MNLSQDAVVVDVKNLCPLGPHKYVGDASMLGFPVGAWPLVVMLTGEGREAQRLDHAGRELDCDGNLVFCHYKSWRDPAGPLVNVLVYND